MGAGGLHELSTNYNSFRTIQICSIWLDLSFLPKTNTFSEESLVLFLGVWGVATSLFPWIAGPLSEGSGRETPSFTKKQGNPRLHRNRKTQGNHQDEWPTIHATGNYLPIHEFRWFFMVHVGKITMTIPYMDPMGSWWFRNVVGITIPVPWMVWDMTFLGGAVPNKTFIWTPRRVRYWEGPVDSIPICMFSWSFRTKHPGVSWVMLIYLKGTLPELT